MDQQSAPLSPLRDLGHVQRAILVAFLLPLFSLWSYWTFFFIGGLHADYWVRNAHYPLLALTHDLGILGIRVAFVSALLACIQLAYGGIKRFGRADDGPFHRLILVTMWLPVALLLLAFFFPIVLQEAVGIPIFVGGPVLTSLLLAGWGVVRREAFTRAFFHLLPWLFLDFCVLTLALGAFLYPPPENTTPFWGPIALICLLAAPLSFAAVMVWLRLGRQTRSILLMLATVETLGMTLVQLMMAMRLIVLQVLGLSTIWTSELVVGLTLNVLATAVALGFLLTLLPWSRSKAPPANLAEEWVVEPLS